MEKLFKVKLESNDATALINCKSCKNKISISTSSCPQCGDRDPFYYSQIASKTKTVSKYFLIYFTIVLFFCIFIWSNSSWWIALLILLGAGFIGKIIYNVTGQSYLDRMFEEMWNRMRSILDDQTYTIWHKYAYAIFKKNDETN
jgi:hypothetical protein